MSDFVKKPLYKRLNKKYLFSRLEKLERQMTPTPTQGVADISEIAADAVQVYHNNNKISATTPRGETIDMTNYYVPDFSYMTPLSSDLMNTSSGASPWTVIQYGGGIVGNVTGTANHPGIISFGNNGSANAGGIVYAGHTSAFLLQGGEVFETVIQFKSFATQVVSRIGFIDTITSAAEVDGVYLEFTGNGSTMTCTPLVYSNSVLSTGESVDGLGTITYAIDTWWRIRIEINEDLSADFFVSGADDGTMRMHWRISSGLPTSAGRETNCGVKAHRTNTTTTTLLWVDRVDFFNQIALAR